MPSVPRLVTLGLAVGPLDDRRSQRLRSILATVGPGCRRGPNDIGQ